ncbi:26S proteasome non-ATPase regulatory subunit 1-like isoform X1 [Dysidea avara]|uniref:26S proteasome non-ATPase regulatory subunit 1-like isoform X1 n=1 Tax=Dysidea avara TaxID=196820 RepID=UPI003333AB07
MEVDSEKKTDESAEKTDAKSVGDKPAADMSTTEDADKEKEKKEEPLFEMLENPARALPAQLKVVSLPPDARYRPPKPITTGGIFMLVDSQKDEPEELIEPLQANIPGKEDEEPEPEPPEPFEWHDDQ